MKSLHLSENYFPLLLPLFSYSKEYLDLRQLWMRARRVNNLFSFLRQEYCYSCFYTWNKKKWVRGTLQIHVRDITSLYSDPNMINRFRWGLRLLVSDLKRMWYWSLVQKSRESIWTMLARPSLNVLLSAVCYSRVLGVLIPFTPFEAEFFTVVNDAPSKSIPNVRIMLSAFQIICCNLGVL